jgi:hypothetical protein
VVLLSLLLAVGATYQEDISIELSNCSTTIMTSHHVEQNSCKGAKYYENLIVHEIDQVNNAISSTSEGKNITKSSNSLETSKSQSKDGRAMSDLSHGYNSNEEIHSDEYCDEIQSDNSYSDDYSNYEEPITQEFHIPNLQSKESNTVEHEVNRHQLIKFYQESNNIMKLGKNDVYERAKQIVDLSTLKDSNRASIAKFGHNLESNGLNNGPYHVLWSYYHDSDKLFKNTCEDIPYDLEVDNEGNLIFLNTKYNNLDSYTDDDFSQIGNPVSSSRIFQNFLEPYSIDFLLYIWNSNII